MRVGLKGTISHPNFIGKILWGEGGLFRCFLQSHVQRQERIRSAEVVSKKAKRLQKERDSWARYNVLANEAARKGVSVQMLNQFPMHVRVTAHRVVDYWPATQRAWVFGSQHEANKTSPEDVIAMALDSSAAPQLPEGAAEHLRTLQ